MNRVIVTSSRSWDDVGVIRGALDAAYAQLGTFTLAHAGHHGGGEKIAHQLLAGTMPISRYPPHRHVTGISSVARQAAITAGNVEMINDGADLCLAFIGQCISSHCLYLGLHPAHGVTGCIRLAILAGIPVQRYWAPWLADWPARHPTTMRP